MLFAWNTTDGDWNEGTAREVAAVLIDKGLSERDGPGRYWTPDRSLAGVVFFVRDGKEIDLTVKDEEPIKKALLDLAQRRTATAIAALTPDDRYGDEYEIDAEGKPIISLIARRRRWTNEFLDTRNKEQLASLLVLWATNNGTLLPMKKARQIAASADKFMVHDRLLPWNNHPWWDQFLDKFHPAWRSWRPS